MALDEILSLDSMLLGFKAPPTSLSLPVPALQLLILDPAWAWIGWCCQGTSMRGSLCCALSPCRRVLCLDLPGLCLRSTSPNPIPCNTPTSCLFTLPSTYYLPLCPFLLHHTYLDILPSPNV